MPRRPTCATACGTPSSASPPRPAQTAEAELLPLSELLGDERYGLTLVAGPRDSGEREIRGIHSSDYEHPSPWLDEGWVLLTNGLRLRSRPDVQRQLVEELVEVGITALGFGLGLPFKAPPAALIADAKRRGLPVFTVPLSTSFGEMMRRVYTELAVDEARVYQRLTAIQQYLVGAFDEQRPDCTIVERLATLVSARVAVLDPGGGVVASSDELDGGAAWEQLAARPQVGGLIRFQLGRYDCVAVPIGDSHTGRWLVAAARALGPLVKPALQLAAPLLAAADRIDAAAHRHETAVREKLLQTILVGDDSDVAFARAGELGLDLEEPIRVVLARPRARHELLAAPAATAPPLAERAATRLRRAAVQYLVGTLDQDLALLVQADDGGWHRAWEQLRTELGPTVLIASGRPARERDAVRMSFRDARLGLSQLASRRSGATSLEWERLDLTRALLAEAEPKRLKWHVRPILEPLDQHEALRATLEVYFACDLDVGRTASELHLHPNSLRYRLGRIEKLLGRTLRSPDTLADIHLALTAERSAGSGRNGADRAVERARFGESTNAAPDDLRSH